MKREDPGDSKNSLLCHASLPLLMVVTTCTNLLSLLFSMRITATSDPLYTLSMHRTLSHLATDMFALVNICVNLRMMCLGRYSVLHMRV